MKKGKITTIRLGENLEKKFSEHKLKTGETTSEIVRKLSNDYFAGKVTIESFRIVVKGFLDFLIKMVSDHPQLFDNSCASYNFYLKSLKHSKANLSKLSEENLVHELTLILEEIDYAYRRAEKKN